MLTKIGEAYKLWALYLVEIPKLTKYTLGLKIDSLFLEIIELILFASHIRKDQKITTLEKASAKLDALKYFLQILWESKMLDTKKYQTLSLIMSNIGRQLGGWQKQLLK